MSVRIPRGTACILPPVLLGLGLLLTSPGLPMVWDEGNAILRAEQIAHWDWQYTTRREGHPAFYGIVIAMGQWVSSPWLAPLTAARFGPIVLFSLAAGAMCHRMAKDYSAAAALGAVAALALLPRLFAHAHFASFDGPLTSCWVLAWAVFPATRHGPARAVFWGITLGMTFSCKATGWLAPAPFLAWAALYRDRSAARALSIALPVAVATFFLLNPPLWQAPLGGWATFFNLNLNRAANPGLNISTWFLGHMYNLDHPLPWYNTIFWTLVTVPVGILLLSGVGVVTALRQARAAPAGTLLVANWLVLLIVRALPGTPPHDGVRLFLPSFAFLAALAGVGCATIIAWARRRQPRGRRMWACCVAAVVLLYAGSLSSLVWYAPQWLSYYNSLLGGLRGATAMGMEPTYYWDGLDRSVLDWLHANTAAGEKIRFGAGSPENLLLMQRWNTLRRATRPDAPGAFRWYVLQHRPSGWQPPDRWLIEHAQPAYRKTIRPDGWGPWRLDVPLVDVYDDGQYLRATTLTGP
ncbi:MAG: hypothetical protein JXB62_12970 [Pirellulales bacterium]|nr:hypothetical protein [Pirellulales bacterium]